MPVLYGDVVLDVEDKIKMAVLSGDQIVKYLAENLKPKKVVLGSDVDGIYNKDPKKYSLLLSSKSCYIIMIWNQQTIHKQ